MKIPHADFYGGGKDAEPVCPRPVTDRRSRDAMFAHRPCGTEHGVLRLVEFGVVFVVPLCKIAGSSTTFMLVASGVVFVAALLVDMLTASRSGN